jgi:segregation and condensation protein A
MIGAGMIGAAMIEDGDLLFDDADVIAPRSDPDQLKIDIDGWEGPLDLLLTLARNQKVDLRAISILQLVEQYLGFIDNARSLKLELAADYLVMAAWLTYLKSALLLPKDPAVDPSPEELALRLQLRLERLNAMRECGARLMARDRVGRDIFVRGQPEGLRVVRKAIWDCSYFELITAYGQMHARNVPVLHVVKKRAVMTLEEALDRVSKMVGTALDWTGLEAFLPPDTDPALRKSSLASSFAAMLELAKRGTIDLQQNGSFAPLLVRVKS